MGLWRVALPLMTPQHRTPVPGPYACAMKKELGMLQASGITHIICVRQQEEARFVKPNFPQHFDYLCVAFGLTSSFERCISISRARFAFPPLNTRTWN